MKKLLLPLLLVLPFFCFSQKMEASERTGDIDDFVIIAAFSMMAKVGSKVMFTGITGKYNYIKKETDEKPHKFGSYVDIFVFMRKRGYQLFIEINPSSVFGSGLHPRAVWMFEKIN